ncbi:MAG: sugar ABC transporter permease [Eubacteriales bacterium]|nr:sugar ABC transporter permease [Eubacteriales bacterium]
MKKHTGMLVAFLTPALIFFVLIFVYPIIRTALMSLHKVENVTAAYASWEFVGLDNFKTLIKTQLFQDSMWNIFRIWAIGGIVVMGLALLFAVFLNSGIRFKKFFRAVIYMPNIISAVALATMWQQYVFNTKFGLLTGFFKTIGWETMAKIQWTSPENLFWALLFAYCFGMVGYHMLIFSSGIEKIPQDFYEASTLDGATKPKQFFYITLPLLKGVFKTNITMWSITSAGFFIWSQLFSSVNVSRQVITPMVYMYMQAFGGSMVVTERFYGVASAVGVLLALIVVAIFTITNLLIKDDELEF